MCILLSLFHAHTIPIKGATASGIKSFIERIDTIKTADTADTE
jgi:hypothetical protein